MHKTVRYIKPPVYHAAKPAGVLSSGNELTAVDNLYYNAPSTPRSTSCSSLVWPDPSFVQGRYRFDPSFVQGRYRFESNNAPARN